MKKLSLLALMISSMAFANNHLSVQNTVDRTTLKDNKNKAQYINETSLDITLNEKISLESNIRYNKFDGGIDKENTNLKLNNLSQFGLTTVALNANKGLSLSHGVRFDVATDTTLSLQASAQHNFGSVQKKLNALNNSKYRQAKPNELTDATKKNILGGVAKVDYKKDNLKAETILKLEFSKSGHKLDDNTKHKTSSNTIGTSVSLEYTPIENLYLKGNVIYGTESFKNKNITASTVEKSRFSTNTFGGKISYNINSDNITITPNLSVHRKTDTAKTPNDKMKQKIQAVETKISPKVNVKYNVNKKLSINGSLGYDRILTTTKIHTPLGIMNLKNKNNGFVGSLGLNLSF